MSAQGLYPLSTQDGKAIPLDVVKPSSMMKVDFLAGTPKEIVLPAGFDLCYVYATKACVLSISDTVLPAALVDETEYAEAIFIPLKMPMTLMLEAGAASILAEESGSLYISAVEQWAALMQPRQASFG